MNKYEVTIPGRGTYEVESDKELTDAQVYQFALQQAGQEPKSESVKRGIGLATRAAAPTLVGAQLGAAGGPMGAVLGSVAIPAADALNQLLNAIASPFTDKRLIPASQAIQNLMTRAGVPAAPETQTPTERVASAGLETMTSLGRTLPEFIRRGAEITPSVAQGISRQMATAPGTQAVVAPTAVMAGQTVTEATDNPLAGLATTLATGAVGGVKRLQKETPSSQVLSRVAEDRYTQLQESGIQLDNKAFTDQMGKIAKSLREAGYTPTAYPKITGAIEELTSMVQPKDWTELQALRKMIKGGQKSIDPEERRLASILLDEYDNYLTNVPKTDIVAGDGKAVGRAWEEARNTYSRMKKAEVFEDMLETAKLDRSKFTQSGEENSLAKQLRDLAKNEKRMRLFTKDEQEAIAKASKGGTTQNLLKFFGRFAPTGPVSGLFTGGISVMAPAVGVPLAAGAAASRMAATGMRRASVEDLASIMRAGQAPQVTGGMMRATPAITAQGLLTLPEIEEEQLRFLGR
jgi:hypothetical protein